MKIVVIGGSGLIGSRLVTKLREQGHETVAASPKSGVDSITGEGLAEALKGASVVVDVTNSPSWEDAAVLNFFETSTRNLLTYGAAAGVKHHVALSVVGTERMLASGFFRAKMAQENLIKASSNPYTIVRATQFFEFVKGIADFSTEGNKVRLPSALIQPMAADDVASARKSFISMNSSGNTLPQPRIRARLSQTRRRTTTVSRWARKHWSPAMERDLVRRVSKPGSISPRRKRRRAPTSGSVKARPVCVNQPHSNERFIYDGVPAALRDPRTTFADNFRAGDSGSLSVVKGNKRLTRLFPGEFPSIFVLIEFLYVDFREIARCSVALLHSSHGLTAAQ